MIEPKPLMEFFKSCPDSKRVGDVCRALGGQKIPLDAQQRRVVLMVNCCVNKRTGAATQSAGGVR